MSRQQLGIVVVLCLIALGCSAAGQTRVVQLVAENPSSFVSTDPNDPKYIVSLFNDELKAASVLPDLPLGRNTIMTDAKGQQYNCSIPSSANSWSTSIAQKQDTDLLPRVTKTPFELLESLDGLCFYRQDGLWTYEVCHRKHVRQFRQVSFTSSVSSTNTAAGTATAIISLSGQGDLDEIFDAINQGEDLTKLVKDILKADDGNKNEDFSCGKYAGNDKQVEAVLEDASSSGHPLKYVSHTYSGGAGCILTGTARTSEVRYTCVRDTKENVVLSVREFPTCNYVVVVSTPFLCKHPAFTPPAEDLRLISCMAIGLETQPAETSLPVAALPDLAKAPTATAADTAAGSVKWEDKDSRSLSSAERESGIIDDSTSRGDDTGSSTERGALALVSEGELLSAESRQDDHLEDVAEDEDDSQGGHNEGYSGDDSTYGSEEDTDTQQQLDDEQRRESSAASERDEL